MAGLDILCYNSLNLKNKIAKIEHKKIFCGPSKFFEKCFKAHQDMPKKFHDPNKTFRPPSTYECAVPKFNKNKISKNLGLLYKAKYYLNKISLLVLYYSFIHTYSNYGNIAWGSTNRTNI